MATTVGNVIFQISADLKNVQGQLRTLEGNFQSSFSKISATASQAFGAIGLSLSTAAIVGFVKTSVSEIGKLQDVFERTGISADVLLKLRPILENAGSSVEEFANGVNAMQKALVDGSAQTIEAFQKVGISANEILKLAEDPEELLDRVAKGLANVATQTERVAIARDLASRAGARIAPALLELAKGGGVEGLRKTESVISKEDIAAIDAAGDAFNTMFIKAEAIAAKSFINVLQGFKDVAAYIQEHPIKFIFNIDGGFFEIAGKARQLREDVAKATAGAQIGGAKTLVEGTAPGLKETNAQRDFKKALDEQIQSLRSQVVGLTSSKEAAVANAAEIIKGKAAQIGLGQSSEELRKRLDQLSNLSFDDLIAEFQKLSVEVQQAQFAEQLTKANHSLEVQIASMVQGKPAAEALALQYSILDAKLQDIGPAAEEAAKKQRELNNEQARAFVPQTKRELGEAIDTAQRKQVTLGITFNADEEVRAAVESAIDKLVSNPDPRVKKLALEAALELKPQLDAARLKSIQTELGLSLGLDKEFSAVLNRTFTNTFDLAAAKVAALENALQEARQRGLDPLNEGVQELGRRLDQARLDQAASDLAKDLKLASNEAEVFGRSFDLGSANISAIQSQLEKLTRDGLNPANEEMQKLAAQLRDAKVADVFSDLSKDLENAAREAEVLGGAINLPSETVDRLTDSIKRLIAEGLDPLDPKLQDLKAQLEDARAAEHFADAFQGIGDSFLGAFTDLADGGKLKDVMKRLVSNINRSITDALITKPFEDWIKKQTNDLFGGILKLPSIPGTGTGQSVGIPGAAGQIAGAANQTQPAIAQTAIQALSTEATTIIQTQSVEAQTTIQALSAETTTAIEVSSAAAETAITTLGATTEAAITAIQAAAIAAIEAASAGQAVSSSGGSALSSIPLIGSLFSSSAPAAANAAGGASTFASVGAGEIFSTFPALLHEGGKVGPSEGGHTGPPLRFHDGGIMGGGQIMAQQGADQTGLKPGERMIIAQDGEFVINKKVAMQIGMDKLQKLNQDQARIMPKFHFGGTVRNATPLSSLSPQHSVLSTFHNGGPIPSAHGDFNPKIVLAKFHEGGAIERPQIRYSTNIERYHDGGTVSLAQGWDAGGWEQTGYMTAGTMPAQTAMTLVNKSPGNGNGMAATNNAIFINPQFQNRQSVGQTSAQLTAAMEAGKRNR